MAAELHSVATTVYYLWAADFATTPGAWHSGVGGRARYLPRRGSSGVLAVQGLCTVNSRV